MYLSKYILSIILLLSSILIYIGLQFFPGSSIIYIIFSLVFFFYVCHSFLSRDIIFFHCFLSTYLFLGFIVKLFFVEFFLDGKYPEINYLIFSFTEENYNKALIVTSASIMGFLISSLIAKKINLFFITPLNTNGFDYFYKKYRNLILLIFFVFVFFFYFINFEFSIFQKGIISNEPKIIILIFKFLIMLVIPSIISIFLFHELKNKHNLSYLYFILICIDSFLSNLSIISRAMIFNMYGILLGIFYSLKNELFKKKIFMALVSLIFFFISLSAVNITREIIYKNDKIVISNIKDIKQVHSKYNHLKELIIKRFVGIDAVLALTDLDNLNMSMFFDSLSEKFTPDKLSFREQIFKEELIDNQIIENKNTYFIKTIGIVGFFYYSGSYIFVFAMSLIFGLIFSIFEKILRHIFTNNLIFVSIISQIIAYRITHFGYLPINSVIFLSAIILNIVFFIIFYKLLNYIRYKK